MKLNKNVDQKKEKINKNSLKESFSEGLFLLLDSDDVINLVDGLLSDRSIYIENDKFNKLSYLIQENIEKMVKESFEIIVNDLKENDICDFEGE